MPKFYVESGPVRLIFDATTAEQAAVMAFQWTCDKQVEIEAASPLDHVLEAEQRGWQLGDEVWVSEQGFGRWTARSWTRWPSLRLGYGPRCRWSDTETRPSPDPALLQDASRTQLRYGPAGALGMLRMP